MEKMSQFNALTGDLDMLHSLYEFKATYAKTLSFQTNEYFIVHQTTKKKHKHWLEVITKSGQSGFIPSNFVETVAVTPAFYMQFASDALEQLQADDSVDEATRSDTVCRLKEIQAYLQQLPVKFDGDGDAMSALLYQNASDAGGKASTSSTLSSVVEVRAPSQHVVEEPIRLSPCNNSVRENDDATGGTVSPAITHQTVYDLVEAVRVNTQLSHKMSRVAVVTVVQGLHELLPASVFPYLSTILSQAEQSLAVDLVQIDQTHDASRLKVIFGEMTVCKEDSQQRSWTLHDDESVIVEYLTELISILSKADAGISRHVIVTGEYAIINTLVEYYQMEPRWPIRQLLLQTLGILCSLDKVIVNIMLLSILPVELARDMMANATNIPRLNYSVILMTMIFSMGDPMPTHHKDLFGKQFVEFLLDNIEYPPDTDMDDQIPDLFLNCIMSFNLQFVEPYQHIILDVLEKREMAKNFTDKIIILLNREHDPVRIFEHLPAPQHSVLKLFVDIFSRRTTAGLFYTNDLLVVIDIILRNITNLSAGDAKRHQYLELLRRVLRNTNYNEHKHRHDEIIMNFTRILCEDNSASQKDQRILKLIAQEFPEFFK